MGNKRIVVDPITRIEGHLRIEAEISENTHNDPIYPHKIKEAYSAGTMVRGIEKILEGRDPRDCWAIAQRVCGVCTTTHALTSVRAVEDAFGISVPKPAELIRNIMAATLHVHDHVVHFYHLHALDFVDVKSALKANPAEASKLAQKMSSWPKSSPGYFSDLLKKLNKFAEHGQLGIFNHGYWGHPGFKLSSEENLIGVAHYLEALEWQKEIVKIHAIFGGKNPHPNWLVGGMPCSINLSEVNAINSERLNQVKKHIEDAIQFVEQVYLPDVVFLGARYADEALKGYGAGLNNYLAYGDFPSASYKDVKSFLLPRGAVLDFGGKMEVFDYTEINPAEDDPEQAQIKEYIHHSWYKYSKGDKAGIHPYAGETEFDMNSLPEVPYEHLDVDKKYSWLKTPRWKGNPMEVGPLARLVTGYAIAATNKQSGAMYTDIKQAVDDALGLFGKVAGSYGIGDGSPVPETALRSTVGRTAARAVECQLQARWNLRFYNELIGEIKKGNTSTFNNTKWEPETWHSEKKVLKGVGLTEAPRGALGHWVVIEDQKVKSYQLVVPTTWNGSPKDPFNEPGKNRSAFEASLVDTPIHDKDKPLEIQRTLHSFDPCLACSVHIYDPNGDQAKKITVSSGGC